MKPKNVAMHVIDTHCHIHDSEFINTYGVDPSEVLQAAHAAGVEKLICVGTSVQSSREAVAFAEKHDNVYASIAVHPHEAATMTDESMHKTMQELSVIDSNKIVAIGECGLDYYYHQDKKIIEQQKMLLRLHLDLAKKRDLPMIFHVRQAKQAEKTQNNDVFDDFFSVTKPYDIRGVVHSFSSNRAHAEQIIASGLYIGLNGIMTFTTDESQLDAARYVPSEKMLIETDAPYLTPKPFRGIMNEPKHVILITQFLSELRGESQAFLAKQTTENAKKLFQL